MIFSLARASNYLCSLSNAVTEFASSTLETKRPTALFSEGQRGIAFIARCRVLERKHRFQIYITSF